MPKQIVNISQILALNLKEHRRKSGFTQGKLAKKAGGLVAQIAILLRATQCPWFYSYLRSGSSFLSQAMFCLTAPWIRHILMVL